MVKKLHLGALVTFISIYTGLYVLSDPKAPQGFPAAIFSVIVYFAIAYPIIASVIAWCFEPSAQRKHWSLAIGAVLSIALTGCFWFSGGFSKGNYANSNVALIICGYGLVVLTGFLTLCGRVGAWLWRLITRAPETEEYPQSIT